MTNNVDHDDKAGNLKVSSSCCLSRLFNFLRFLGLQTAKLYSILHFQAFELLYFTEL